MPREFYYEEKVDRAGFEGINAAQFSQNQSTATSSALRREDYHADVPESGSPISDLLPAARRTK